MLRPRKAVLWAFVIGVSAAASAAEFKPGEVIVKYKSGIMRTRAAMNTLYDDVGVQDVRHYAGVMKGVEHLILNDGVTVEDAIRNLKENNSVEYAQPNYILHALPIQMREAEEDFPDSGQPCWFPGIPFPPGCDDSGGGGSHPSHPTNPPGSRPALKPEPSEVLPPVQDPDLAKAYGLGKIGAIEAWSLAKGSKDFIVADIDTGIDYNHDDLSFNIWRNPNPTDRNDVVGFDFIHNDGLAFDDNLHGTHTAGTIGAVGGNGVGISGVNQRVSIMALKFLSADGSGTTADAVRAIDYAITHGAKVLSNSWGGKGDTDNQILHEAIIRAQQKGVIFVAAAGNDGTDNDGSDPSFPAAFQDDNMISVAATDSNDSMAYFSNYGPKTTHVAAPGLNIYSTVPGNGYKNLSGTSMACPHVAGAVALLWSSHPTWDYKKVKAALLKSVDILPALSGKVMTGGRINIRKALQESFE